MTDEYADAHRYFAIATFNATWELIEKPGRTQDEDAAMLQSAFASRWHWGFVGGPEQFAAGDWQIAHVASLLGFGLLAQTYALRSLEVAETNGFTDWRLASAYEGVARAAVANGDPELHTKYYALAAAAIEAIEDDDEREVIAGQFASVPLP